MLSLPGDDPMEGKKKTSIIDLMKFGRTVSSCEKVTCFAGGDPLLHRRNQISSSLILKLGAKCRRTRGFRVSGGWIDVEKISRER